MKKQYTKRSLSILLVLTTVLGLLSVATTLVSAAVIFDYSSPIEQRGSIYFNRWNSSQHSGDFKDKANNSFAGVGMHVPGGASGTAYVKYNIPASSSKFTTFISLDSVWCGTQEYGTSTFDILFDNALVFSESYKETFVAEIVEIPIPQNAKIITLRVQQTRGTKGNHACFFGSPAFVGNEGNIVQISYKNNYAIWDDALFSQNPSASSYPGSEPWKDLAVVSGLLSGLVYNDDEIHSIEDTYKVVGLKDYTFYNTTSDLLQPGYAFGHKTIIRNGKSTNLVVAVFRGTDRSSFANGFADISTDILQAVAGINLAATIAKSSLDLYMNLEGIDPSQAVFLITGHSLGGGMANCVADSLSATYGADDVFAFTFASPKTAPSYGSHKNISNILSTTDTVIYLGPVVGNMTYHYGSNYYVSTPVSLPFGASHDIVNYIIGAMVMSGTGLQPAWYNYLLVQCPVDVEVYDNSNKLVGQIVNSNVTNKTLIPAFVDGDDKYFIVPNGENHSIRMLATDSGTMDYTVAAYDLGVEAFEQRKTFSNVQLQKGKRFKSEVGQTIATHNVELHIVDNTNTPIARVAENGAEIYILTVTNGSGGGNFAQGAIVTITANTAPSGQRFKQWNISPSVSFTGGTDTSSATAKFNMPAGAVTATAIYESIPATTYLLTVVSGSGGGNFAANATVTITADAAPNGKVFDKWTATAGTLANANSATTTFTMPAGAATVTATYKDAGGGTSTPPKGIFGTNAKWYGEWWHYLLFFCCFGFIWMW